MAYKVLYLDHRTCHNLSPSESFGCWNYPPKCTFHFPQSGPSTSAHIHTPACLSSVLLVPGSPLAEVPSASPCHITKSHPSCKAQQEKSACSNCLPSIRNLAVRNNFMESLLCHALYVNYLGIVLSSRQRFTDDETKD